MTAIIFGKTMNPFCIQITIEKYIKNKYHFIQHELGKGSKKSVTISAHVV